MGRRVYDAGNAGLWRHTYSGGDPRTYTPPTAARRPRRLRPLAVFVAILAVGVGALYFASRPGWPAEDGCQPGRDARHATAQLPGSGTIDAMANGDEGPNMPSGVAVTITGYSAAANTTVRVAVDTDTDRPHADNLADGRTKAVTLDHTGYAGTVLTDMAPGPATVHLYQRSAGVVATLHLTIPTCK